ncbi:unnamed protein product [Phaedon cochleariae]|uniref:Cuticle protein n=1 Tax=Phaedon cochleariae TaxID=80249 RepID=A0A9N9SCM8_PHACE|nr:unnamed protein product [Phaedon cochleariae]
MKQISHSLNHNLQKRIFEKVVYWISTTSTTNGWDTPSTHQYHIQTDEGAERYFRYQTDSGQYRKEKRLEDGTVIGTYAWIDADGMLRQRDYIADSAGYRILKSKKVYVGRNVNVGEAVKATKKYPASAGTLVKANHEHVARPVITVPYQGAVSNSLSSTYIPSTTTIPVISNAYIPDSPTHSYIPSTTPAPIVSTTPYVDVSPNSILSTTQFAQISNSEPHVVEITPNSYRIPTSTPYDLLLPPHNFTTPRSSYIPSPPNSFTIPTETPYYGSEPTETYLPSIPSSTERPYYQSTLPPPQPQYISGLYDSLPQGYKEVDHNSLDYNPYVRQVDNSYRFSNGPTYPIDKNGKPYHGQNIGNGYDPQYPTYDGVSVTNDGFRYYIPRAYHEEESSPSGKRSGSFGYIDPFGIRRVIYYNTAPGTGFQHRKNNRYVGFQATPYDPRPY